MASEQGERGDSGQRGVAGERGPKGDHGQHGPKGNEGLTGLDGEIGARGRQGIQGEQGEQGIQGKTEPTTIWFGVNRWNWAGAAFLLIVLMGVFTTWRIDQRFESIVKDFDKTLTEESIIRARDNCETDNKIIGKIRVLIEAATSGALPIDYTNLPEFQALDKNSKTFFMALRAKSQTDGNAAARTEFMKGFDFRECTKEFSLPPVRSK